MMISSLRCWLAGRPGTRLPPGDVSGITRSMPLRPLAGRAATRGRAAAPLRHDRARRQLQAPRQGWGTAGNSRRLVAFNHAHSRNRSARQSCSASWARTRTRTVLLRSPPGRRCCRGAAMARRRGDDDPSAAPPGQQRRENPQDVGRAVQVHRDLVMPVRVRISRKGLNAWIPALAKTMSTPLHACSIAPGDGADLIDAALVGNVLHPPGTRDSYQPSRLGQVFDGGGFVIEDGAHWCSDINPRHVRPGRAQRDGGGSADPAGRAGHDCVPAGQRPGYGCLTHHLSTRRARAALPERRRPRAHPHRRHRPGKRPDLRRHHRQRGRTARR